MAKAISPGFRFQSKGIQGALRFSECYRREQEFYVSFAHQAYRYSLSLDMEVVEQLLQLVKIHTNQNVADILTKVVIHEKLELCTDKVGMVFSK